MYAKNFHAEPYEIQHVVIALNFEDKKKRKNIVQNLLRRSREMKVYIKPELEDKNRKNNSLHFAQGSFHQGNALLFPTTAGRHYSCMVAMFAIVYSVFKHVNLWDYKDLDDILLQGGQIYKDLKTNVFLNTDEIPRQVDLFGVSVELDFTQNKFGMLFGNQNDHSYLINCITVGDIFYCWSMYSNNTVSKLCLFVRFT